MGVLKKGWLEGYLQLSFMHVCKYLKQRVRRTGENNGQSFKVVSKTKDKKKKKMKRLSFMTQFKIEFLLLWSNCRKLLVKIDDTSKLKNF